MPDRRFRPDPEDGRPQVSCRNCFAHVEVDADKVEFIDGIWLYRCPSCDRHFPVRREDAPEALRTPPE